MKPNELEYSPRLRLLWKQSHLEAGFTDVTEPADNGKLSPAIYPKSYIELIQNMPDEKLYDYCFRGALYIDEKTLINRSWIIDFAKNHFTKSSYLQITDSNAKKRKFCFLKTHKVLGTFDHTFRDTGFTPKEHPVSERGFFDHDYFALMKQSKFTLCPAGDAPWSMRFYESIMAKSIPIVENPFHSGRNIAEYEINYDFYTTATPSFDYREDWVESNYIKFIRHQTLLGAK